MSGNSRPLAGDFRPSVGIHVSISERIDLAIDRALDLGCVGTFQIFTCSPRRWAASELDPAQAGQFRHKAKDHNFTPFAHMPYMPNLASPEDDFYTQSVEVLTREVKRCSKLGVDSLVLHFGSHLGSSIDQGHERVIKACRNAIKETQDSPVRLLLETSSGTRNSIGSRFEFVQKVLVGVGNERRAGVCLDTCHVFSSGYDLRTEEAVQKTIEDFDSVVGLSNLYLIHLNDSKGGLGEGKDRHEHIGLGQIGAKGFQALLNTERLRQIPLILETPIDRVRDDKQDVAYTKKIAGI